MSASARQVFQETRGRTIEEYTEAHRAAHPTQPECFICQLLAIIEEQAEELDEWRELERERFGEE